MNDKKLFVIGAKSLLQTNATILAGALIFLTLSEQLTILATALFLIGIYLTVLDVTKTGNLSRYVENFHS